MDIRNRLLTSAHTVQEVGPVGAAFVAFHRQAFVDFADGVIGQGVVGEFVYRFTNQFSAIDEDPSLVPFDKDAVVGVIADDHLGTTGISSGELEACRGVVTVVLSLGIRP